MNKPKIISIPQLDAIAVALADLTKTLSRGKEKEDEGYDAEEQIKYLNEKLEKYEKVVHKIIRPLFSAGVPDEVIRTLIEGKSTVSVFYDKNKLGRSVQNVDMRFTARNMKALEKELEK